MNKIFKQESKKIVAFAFAGLIAISQLMVINMGYRIPMYFLVVLLALCIMIVWGMIDIDIKIDEDILIIKSGPFSNKIAIDRIEKLEKELKSVIKFKKNENRLTIIYNNNKRMTIFPLERAELIESLKAINSKIIIE